MKPAQALAIWREMVDERGNPLDEGAHLRFSQRMAILAAQRALVENEALTLMGTGTAQMASGAYERLQRMDAKLAAALEIVRAVAVLWVMDDDDRGRVALYSRTPDI